MSLYLNDVADSIRAGIVAALPALLPANGGGGIIEWEQIDAIAFDDLVQAMPYGSFRLLPATADEEFGSVNDYYQADVEMVIVLDANGNNDNVRPSVEAIRDRFLHIGINNALVIQVSEVDCSDAVGSNRIFISKGDTQRCGGIKAKILFGDDAE